MTEETRRISTDAVREATGRGWSEWFALLDSAGAADWSHREIVAWLGGAHPGVDSGWWRQTITAAYEQERGKRVAGQTADGGFEVGVQRTVAADPATTWAVLTSRPDLWLGRADGIAFEAGVAYDVERTATAPAATGEIRIVRPEHRLRLTWRPETWRTGHPATLQLTLVPARSGGTSLRVHLERLADAPTRESMRSHWRSVLDRIADALASPVDS